MQVMYWNENHNKLNKLLLYFLFISVRHVIQQVFICMCIVSQLSHMTYTSLHNTTQSDNDIVPLFEPLPRWILVHSTGTRSSLDRKILDGTHAHGFQTHLALDPVGSSLVSDPRRRAPCRIWAHDACASLGGGEQQRQRLQPRTGTPWRTILAEVPSQRTSLTLAALKLV